MCIVFSCYFAKAIGIAAAAILECKSWRNNLRESDAPDAYFEVFGELQIGNSSGVETVTCEATTPAGCCAG